MHRRERATGSFLVLVLGALIALAPGPASAATISLRTTTDSEAGNPTLGFGTDPAFGHYSFLNMLVDGQVQGGIVQALGQAMYEEIVYDEQGQLVTGTLMDYAVPKASMIPWMELDRTETPSPVNPMGVKGVGEAGTIGATPAIVGAVVDALSPFGVRHLDMPIKPENVWRIISAQP